MYENDWKIPNVKCVSFFFYLPVCVTTFTVTLDYHCDSDYVIACIFIIFFYSCLELSWPPCCCIYTTVDTHHTKQITMMLSMKWPGVKKNRPTQHVGLGLMPTCTPTEPEISDNITDTIICHHITQCKIAILHVLTHRIHLCHLWENTRSRGCLFLSHVFLDVMPRS